MKRQRNSCALNVIEVLLEKEWSNTILSKLTNRKVKRGLGVNFAVVESYHKQI